MWRRGDPVTRLRKRLDAFGATMDPRHVLEPGALRDAEAATDFIDRSRRGGGPVDERTAEALFLLACLHWYRYQVLPAGQDAADLRHAIALTELLLVVAPQHVPPSLLAMLAAHRPRGADTPTAPRSAPPAPRRPLAEAGARATAGAGRGRAVALVMEAVNLMAGAERTGDYRVADRAEALLREALAAIPPDDLARTHALSALGRVHRDQFLHLGRNAALPRAIEAHRQSLEATRPDDGQRAVRLFNLGNVLGDRFDVDGDTAALDEAITLLAAVPDQPGAGAPLAAMARLNLAQRLGDRWRLRADPADLDRAVTEAARAQDALDDPRAAVVWARLLVQRYAHGGAPADRDAAIEAYRMALAGGAAEGPDGYLHRAALGELLSGRYAVGGDPADLDAAIEAYLAAVDAADAENRGALQSPAGMLLEKRYERDRRPDDLAAAVGLLRAAADAAEGAERGDRLGRLGYVLSRWLAAHDGDARGAARAALEEAARLLPAGHPGRPNVLSNLGELLRQTGEAELLRPAAAALREAVAAAGPGHPQLSAYLSNLGLVLQTLFAETQDQAVLDEAVDVLTRALDDAAPGDDDRLPALTNLGNALNRRVELNLPDDHPPPQERSVEAGRDRAAVEADARRAIEVLREAADLARRAAAPNETALVLGSLATAHLLRHLLLGDPGLLDEGIELLEQVRTMTPPGAAYRHQMLTNLGNARLVRFRATGDPADRAAMEAAYREAVAALPATHPDRAMCLSNLATALESVAGAAESVAGQAAAALAAAEAALAEAMAVEAAPSLLRAMAAWRYARHADRRGDLTGALTGYATTIELLDLVAWHGMAAADQERLLTEFPRLATDAAAVAIALGRPERAVELLEHGRAVLLARAHDAQADLTRLRAAHPELAERLAELQRALDGFDLPPSGDLALPSSGGVVPWSGGLTPRSGGFAPWSGGCASPGAVPPGGAVAERRHELAVRRRELLTRIRREPGFADFLRPASFAGLAEAASEGPVVLVVEAERRCDALVLRDGAVRVVPLPGLTRSELIDRVRAFLVALAECTGSASAPAESVPAPADPGKAGALALDRQRRRAAARRTLTDTLDWLWRVVAGPVLDALGLPPAADGGDGPRLWWCPTGLLTLLPLHAAAPAGAGDGVPERVVSSYTVSLGALLRARQRRPATATPMRTALFVGMPHTPGLPDLPGTRREEEAVRRHLSDVRSLVGPDATPAAVLAALAERPVAHLSCHGTQDLAAPARGRLALAGGPLHVRDVWGLRRAAPAALAVLSACETVRGGAILPDEALTLGTAVQLAGYRHVIGALWSISDGLTADLCADVYDRLAVAGGIDPERAPVALHRALRPVRHALRDLPELWAGYVHLGP